MAGKVLVTVKNIIKVALLVIMTLAWLCFLFDIGNMFVTVFIVIAALIPELLICAGEDGLHQGENIHSQKAVRWSRIVAAVIVIVSLIKMILM